jgi:hypothetical protein
LLVNNDNGGGLRVYFIPFYGTTYTDNTVTNEVWRPSWSLSIWQNMTTTWASTNGATFDVTGVQFETGDESARAL